MSPNWHIHRPSPWSPTFFPPLPLPYSSSLGVQFSGSQVFQGCRGLCPKPFTLLFRGFDKMDPVSHGKLRQLVILPSLKDGTGGCDCWIRWEEGFYGPHVWGHRTTVIKTQLQLLWFVVLFTLCNQYCQKLSPYRSQSCPPQKMVSWVKAACWQAWLPDFNSGDHMRKPTPTSCLLIITQIHMCRSAPKHTGMGKCNKNLLTRQELTYGGGK